MPVMMICLITLLWLRVFLRRIPDLIKNKLAQHLPAQTLLQGRFLKKTIEDREIKKDIKEMSALCAV